MHLPTLPPTLSILLLIYTTTTVAAASPKPSSFTGSSTLTGPAPTIETDTEPVLNHGAALAQTTASLKSAAVPNLTATSVVSGSILMDDGTPIETLIPIYTGTPPLIVTDAAGNAVSSHKAKATMGTGGDEGGTLLDMSSSGSSSSGAGAVRWGEGATGKSVVGLLVGVVVGVVVF